MKKYIYFLLLVIIYTGVYTISAFAQVGEDDENIWSQVRFNPFGAENIDPNYKWDENTYEPRFIYGADATVEPNFRPWPGSGTTQSEMSIDVHPLNEDIIFASANATNWPVTTLWGSGVYWSLNGAANWVGHDNPPFGTNSGDPASVIGVNGNFYENYITNSYGQGIAVSTNNGTSWTTHTVAPNPGSVADKNHMMVDKTPGSPYVNRLYVAFTDFGGTDNYDAVIRYSSNDGVNWSSSINLSSSLGGYLHQGVNIQTASNGDVYCTWAVYDGSGVSSGEDRIGFAKSTDGGVTWTTSVAYSSTDFGIRGYLKPTSIRVSSFPSMAVDRSGGANDGTIYICWPQENVSPAGSDPDIVLIKSTNGGTSWTSPVRVNDDLLNNGKDQYFPWMTVDQTTGQAMIVLYDNRETTNDSSGVWMATSVNGGTTWENFRVSDENFRPKPISGLAGGYQGDYIGIASHNNVAYPFWADDRTGNYQGWMSVVTFGPPCPVDPPTNPSPANGTIDVPISLAQLTWTNGAGATENELWFGEAGNMQLVHSGTLASSYTIPALLTYSTVYQWQVIEQNDTCSVNGSVWSFTTEDDPSIVTDLVFFDDFESGIGQWTVTNNGGTCVWEIFLPTYPNSYTLPATSSGGVLAADSDECGNGTTFLSTATIVPILDLSTYTEEVWIEFDNDWNVIDAQDEAHVEVSTNGGSTWTGVWDQIGTDIRNTHEVVDVTSLLSGQSNVSVRVRVVQPGWDWWWALDNFSVYGRYLLPDVADPTSFTATAISDSEIDISFTPNASNDNVVITWNLTGTFTEPTGPPPTLGQPFAGGTLLYNGTTSPVSHSGLNEQTVYYYKAFSYDNVDYSAGIEVNDTTFETPIVTDFAVDFLVYDNCANSISLTFGTAPSATECYDEGLDEWAPPPPPTGVFDGRFTACSEDLFIDYKATNPDGLRIWDVHYRPTTGCEPISFSWDPGQLPLEGNFHLIDPHTGGNWVNVDMRTTTNYADILDLGYLQIIYNYEVCAGFDFADGWNMLSLPLAVADANYLSLFPNANPGSLFEYSEGYFFTDTVETCTGYWLKMPGAEVVDVCGTDITECVIDLELGWNMIGGPNCSVLLSSVGDPGGIIIPGSLFRYAGGYFTSTSIDATEGYWINANAPGTITVSCGAPLAKNSNDLIIPLETLTDFGKIDISDGINTGETLYFNGKLDEAVSIESYSMPPVPPQGSFDLRLTGGYRLSESDEVTIQVQSTNYPLSVTITDLKYEEGYGYLLQEIVGGVEVGSHRIVDGVEIVIGNENVSLLKITKQEALPTKFALEQNYPNPFNPSTVIEFSLPEDVGNIKLTIYNVLGQRVAELVNTSLVAGKYSYQWDATNAATGMYIYELRTEKFVSTKKMVLMK